MRPPTTASPEGPHTNSHEQFPPFLPLVRLIFPLKLDLKPHTKHTAGFLAFSHHRKKPVGGQKDGNPVHVIPDNDPAKPGDQPEGPDIPISLKNKKENVVINYSDINLTVPMD